MMDAPLSPMRSLEPVWSGCQCVLISTFTFEAPVAFEASRSTSEDFSKLPPSTSSEPSLVPSATTLPPPPLMRLRFGASGVVAITGPLAANAGLETRLAPNPGTEASAAPCMARVRNSRRERSFIRISVVRNLGSDRGRRDRGPRREIRILHVRAHVFQQFREVATHGRLLLEKADAD